MNDKIKVLCIEDSEMDSELIKIEIKRGGLNFEYSVVDTKAEYVEALDQFQPDIILCDHSLPSFNSLEALNILKSQKKTIPFILITGAVTEEVASQVVKDGADDFVLKDRLKRLPYAVLNAVEKYRYEEERNQLIHEMLEQEAASKKMLSASANKLLLATQAARIAVWEYYLLEDRVVCDDAMYLLFGRKPEDLKSNVSSWINHVHPLDREHLYDIITNCREAGGEFQIECRVVLPTGSISYLKCTGITEKNDHGQNYRIIGTTQDISADKLKEQKIVDSEEKYRSIFENSMDAILLTSPSEEILAANAAACRLFQMSGDEICQLQQKDLLFEMPPSAQVELLEKTGNQEAEITFIKKDGSQFPAEVSSSSFTDSSGRKRTSMIIRDISERKKLELALEREKERYTTVFLNSPSCVGVFKGPHHVLEMANPYYLQLIAKTDVVGKSVCDVFPESTQMVDLLNKVYESKQQITGKEWVVPIGRTDDGMITETFFDFACIPHTNGQGCIDAIFFFANDVTEEVQLRRRIEKSEKSYRDLFHYSPLPKFLVAQNNLGILMVNKASVNHYGYSEPEFLTMSFLDLFKPEDRNVIASFIRDAAGTSTPYKTTASQLRKTGATIIAEISAVEFNYSNQPCFLIGVNDFTEQIKLQKSISDLKLSAQKKITRAQIRGQEEERELIGEELHDNVNQQLCTIQLYLDLAQKEKDMSDELLQRSEKIIRTTIQDIRKLCKSLVPPSMRFLGLIASLKELIGSYTPVQSFSVHFTCHPVADKLNEELQLAIFRIIQEQLNNISKYAKARNVWISLNMRSTVLDLLIKDDGKGFKIPNKPSGLGFLNIRNRLDVFNGTFNITSAPGKGCSLKIEIPLESPGEGTDKIKSILIAEDDLIDQELMEQAVQEFDKNCVLNFVRTGQELIDHLNSLPDAQLPSLLIIDYYLPQMNGLESLRTLERTERFKKIPKVIYSGSVNKRHADECIQANAKGYFRKGITKEEIRDTIRQMVKASRNN